MNWSTAVLNPRSALYLRRVSLTDILLYSSAVSPTVLTGLPVDAPVRTLACRGDNPVDADPGLRRSPSVGVTGLGSIGAAVGIEITGDATARADEGTGSSTSSAGVEGLYSTLFSCFKRARALFKLRTVYAHPPPRRISSIWS